MPVSSPPSSVGSGAPFGASLAREVGLAAVTALALFAAPAVPQSLADAAALRAIQFFHGLAASHPAFAGDGPFAVLLQPVFGRADALAHVLLELAASIGVGAIAVCATRDLRRTLRLAVLAALVVVTAASPMAGWWLAAGLAARACRSGDAGAQPFLQGSLLGAFGLLSFPFLAWSLALTLIRPGARRGTNALPVALAGWAAVILTGWSVLRGTGPGFLKFLGDGIDAIGGLPGWQLASAVALVVLAAIPMVRIRAGIATPLALGGLLLSGPIPGAPPTMADNLADFLAARGRAWLILVHPERFENRVLQPAWRALAAERPLPGFAEQVGAAPVDVFEVEPLLAVANGLQQIPRSWRGGVHAVLAPAGLAQGNLLLRHGYAPILAANGVALYVRSAGDRGGLAPFPLWRLLPLSHEPSYIETAAPPERVKVGDAPALAFAAPARLVFGPTPFAAQHVVGRYFWDGAAGRIRVHLHKADGTDTVMLERGLNPAFEAGDRGLQNFSVDLPDVINGWIEVEASAGSPSGPAPRFQLVDLEFKRDLTRMMPTVLAPDMLHGGAGFKSMPALIFATSEASPAPGARGEAKLLVHMPSVVVFAKPREARRLTGIFGFLPGAYENPEAGTAGAVFNITWYSANDGARQIFSRTLKPRTVAADRGPQPLDLDISGLPDGLLSFQITPAVAGDISWGWTYLGEIDLRGPDDPGEQERYAEAMDAWRAGLRPLPGLLKTSEQRPKLIDCGDESLLRVHAPGEAVFGITGGHTRATGKFGFADEAWSSATRTDGADFTVLWRDHHGEKVLFRQHLDPVHQPGDRGLHEFSVDLTNRGSGLLVLQTGPGPAHNNFWDWTGWSDLTVW